MQRFLLVFPQKILFSLYSIYLKDRNSAEQILAVDWPELWKFRGIMVEIAKFNSAKISARKNFFLKVDLGLRFELLYLLSFFCLKSSFYVEYIVE